LLEQAFELRGVDVHGLTKTDREYLRLLIESEEPTGGETLATTLGESMETIEQSLEPYLLREGYVRRTPRGRVATEKARALFQGVTA
jgi:holliday junction DNA helicase RuvB